MPALQSNTVAVNWTDLVTRSSESFCNADVESSKKWFNKQFLDLDEPNLGFDATFAPLNAHTNEKLSVDYPEEAFKPEGETHASEV